MTSDLSFQAGLQRLPLPHVGVGAPGAGVGLAGALGRGRGDVARRLAAAAREVLPHEDPVQEGLHPPRELRDHSGKDGGDARQGMPMVFCSFLVVFSRFWAPLLRTMALDLLSL